MKQLTLFACLLLWPLCSLLAQPNITQNIIAGRRNSPEQQQKPYVILISADGFRYDYAAKYQCEHLLQLAQQGVQAQGLLPSFPSKTFPNHYTLVTGLYPAHHGLINNSFYDPKHQGYYTISNPKVVRDSSWYGGKPLWVVAEQNQMLSASFYWPGSEAAIQGVRPSYYYNYSEAIGMEQRIQAVVDWLNLPEDRRPHLITFYMPEVDHAGHSYGPEAPETGAAARFVDASLKKLTEAVAATGLPVNFLFVADHGMVLSDVEKTMPTPAVDTAKFVVSKGDIIVELYAKDQSAKTIQQAYKTLKKNRKGYQVYLKNKVPSHLHYSAKDDSLGRMGDIVLIAEAPKIFWDLKTKPSPGHHGYDPQHVKDLQATFYAWGPAFKSGVKLPVFENVHVFPIITQLLGLKYNFAIDGNRKVAEQVLVPTSVQ